MESPVADSGVGARVLRNEDDRHLRGQGEYIADICLPAMRELASVRNPVTHETLECHSAARTRYLGAH